MRSARNMETSRDSLWSNTQRNSTNINPSTTTDNICHMPYPDGVVLDHHAHPRSLTGELHWQLTSHGTLIYGLVDGVFIISDFVDAQADLEPRSLHLTNVILPSSASISRIMGKTNAR